MDVLHKGVATGGCWGGGKFQVKSARCKKGFRYFRDLHVIEIKDQAKVVAPLVKYDIL